MFKINLKSWLLFVAILCLCSAQIYGQTKVNGNVTDQLGSVAGVTIRNKTSGQNTTANEKGFFSIGASLGDVLEFTSVGYLPQRFEILDFKNIGIVLSEDAQALSEVVVVGYGTQKKLEVTGAVSVINNSNIVNRPTTNVLGALQGMAPGLVVTRTNGQPGKEGYAAQIRGASSVNGSSPLILVDGVEQASIGTLDQNDIESVTVLKDASASAIYGARGANGVILITSKKGTQGKLKVAVNSIFTINHAYNIPNKLHSYEEASMLNEARVNAGNTSAYSPEQIEWMKDPDFNYRVNPTDPSSYEYFYDVDMIDSVMRPNRNSFQQQQNINVSGGDAKTQYLASLGWYTQNGIFRFGPDASEKYNGRLNLNTKLTDWLSLDSRIAYANSNIASPSVSVGGDYGLLYNMYTLRSLYPIHLPNSNFYTSGVSSNQTYAQLKDGGQTDERTDNVNGVFTLQASNFIKGLSIKAIYAPFLQAYNNNNTRRLIPQYNINGAAAYWNNPNSYTVQKSNIFRANYQFLADYDFSLNRKNNFHLLGGYQIETFRSESSTAVARNLSSNNVFSLNLGDPTQYSGSDAINTWATESYFGRLNYNYDEKYFIEGVIRVDGSSKLAPRYRYNTFPSVSAGWRLSKEPWFNQTLPFFNEFKLRASYGRLGNSDLSNFGSYDYLSLLNKSDPYPFNNTNTYGYYNGTLASPQKTWEKINTTNMGVDLAMFNNKLTLSGDYYVKKNENMLVQVNTSALIGISTAQYNAASMKSWGWEISLGWKDLIGEKFNYWISGNLSDNQNKVLSYLGQSVVTAGLNSVIEGEEINSVWGYQASGLFSDLEQVNQHAYQSNVTAPGDIIFEDKNGDNRIDGGRNTLEDHGDLMKLGSTTPRHTFGFTLGGSIGGFDFSAFFQGVGKRSMLINSYYTVPFVESWRQPIEGQTDYWTPENMDARFPRLFLGGGQNLSPSSWWIQNAAYIRLKNLQIGYTLPAKITQKAHLSSVRIYFTGQDLWEKSGMWLNFYDPEEPNNSTLNYPLFRSYALGLNITI